MTASSGGVCVAAGDERGSAVLVVGGQPGCSRSCERVYGIEEQQVRDDDGQALEDDGGLAGVLEIGDIEHLRVDEPRDLRQRPLEPGEEGRVVQRPLAGAVRVPLLHRQRVGDGQPVTVHLEVGRAVQRPHHDLDHRREPEDGPLRLQPDERVLHAARHARQERHGRRRGDGGDHGGSLGLETRIAGARRGGEGGAEGRGGGHGGGGRRWSGGGEESGEWVVNERRGRLDGIK